MSSQQAKVNWYRVAISPEKLQALNQPDDTKGFIQAGGHLALTVLTAGVTIYVWAAYAWYWTIPLIYIHGSVQTMLGAGVHELVHERVFRTKKYNRFFLAVNSFLTHWNYPFFHISHKEHHRYTLNEPLDLEVTLSGKDSISLFNRSQLIPNWKGIRGNIKLHWGFAFNDYWRNGEEKGIHGEHWMAFLIKRLGEKERAEIRDWSRFYLGAHAAIIVISLLLGWWIVPLVVTFGSQFGGFFGQLTHAPQHFGLLNNVNDFRLSCRTYVSNRLVEFLYWNMNYHIEHHMYAAVPCYNLPKLHKEIKDYLPPEHTLVSAWGEMLNIAHLRKTDSEYALRQTLPEELPGSKLPLLTHELDGSAQDYLALSDKEVAIDMDQDWKIWECEICAFIYDEALGLPEEGLAPGTRWEDIPEDWACPDCGVAKSDFRMVERSRVEAAEETLPPVEATLSQEPIVIVGSGMAGYTLAREYRALNATQKVVLLTRDGGENYSKPQLSNALAQKKDAQSLISKRAKDMAEELKVQVDVGVEVKAIDRENKVLETSIGQQPYSKLILALGADQRRLPFEGDAADQILTVNDLSDYKGFRQKLPENGSVLILGAGLIGCEFANDLIENGHEVTVLDLAEAPLSAMVPTEVGNDVQQKLQEKGVHWKMGTTMSSVDSNGEQLCATLDDGSKVIADVVLSSIGLSPRTDLAQASGLEVNRGIVTDSNLATSDPSIFALGDCSEVGQQVRLYISPLRQGAAALAKTLAGTPTNVQYPPMPVIVKTPACPVVVLGPQLGVEGEWKLVEAQDGHECHYVDGDNQIRGFALSGKLVEKRAELLGKVAG